MQLPELPLDLAAPVCMHTPLQGIAADKFKSCQCQAQFYLADNFLTDVTQKHLEVKIHCSDFSYSNMQRRHKEQS